MAVTIFLKAFKDKSTNEVILHLHDTEGHDGDQTITTDVKPGEVVIWKLAKNSDILEIMNVYKKQESREVFSTKPHQISASEWKGIVADDAKGNESYNIQYKYIDDTVFVDDPEIQIRPPKKINL